MLSWEIVEHGKPLQKTMKETPKPQGSEVDAHHATARVCPRPDIWEGTSIWEAASASK